MLLILAQLMVSLLLTGIPHYYRIILPVGNVFIGDVDSTKGVLPSANVRNARIRHAITLLNTSAIRSIWTAVRSIVYPVGAGQRCGQVDWRSVLERGTMGMGDGRYANKAITLMRGIAKGAGISLVRAGVGAKRHDRANPAKCG